MSHMFYFISTLDKKLTRLTCPLILEVIKMNAMEVSFTGIKLLSYLYCLIMSIINIMVSIGWQIGSLLFCHRCTLNLGVASNSSIKLCFGKRRTWLLANLALEVGSPVHLGKLYISFLVCFHAWIIYFCTFKAFNEMPGHCSYILN